MLVKVDKMKNKCDSVPLNSKDDIHHIIPVIRLLEEIQDVGGCCLQTPRTRPACWNSHSLICGKLFVTKLQCLVNKSKDGMHTLLCQEDWPYSPCRDTFFLERPQRPRKNGRTLHGLLQSTVYDGHGRKRVEGGHLVRSYGM